MPTLRAWFLTNVPAMGFWLGLGHWTARTAVNRPRARQRAQARLVAIFLGLLVLVLLRALIPRPGSRVDLFALWAVGVAELWFWGRWTLRLLRLTPPPA